MLKDQYFWLFIVVFYLFLLKKVVEGGELPFFDADNQ